MIKIKNKIKTNYRTLSMKLITSAVISSIILPNIPASYANPEENERGSIRVYRTFNKVGTLVAPEHLKIEYLDVNFAQKKLTVFQTGKEPQEINPAFHPSAFPWHLSPEKMESFINSQSFLLKQLDNEEYKLDMYTPGYGGSLPIIGTFVATKKMSEGMADLISNSKIKGKIKLEVELEIEIGGKNSPTKKPTPRKSSSKK